METVARSIGKTVSYRVAGTLVTAGLAYLLTRRWELAFTLGTADTAIKLVVFFLHERLWERISFGRRRGHEHSPT
jgi:uncharacterized membrane protein